MKRMLFFRQASNLLDYSIMSRKGGRHTFKPLMED